jgi:hypothetical protein
MPEKIICDGILHVNMFHYFKIPYFTCKVFTKFTYNEYIGPYFLSHVVLRFSPSDLPGNQWFSLAKIALKVPHDDRKRSLVARTNRCEECIRSGEAR